MSAARAWSLGTHRATPAGRPVRPARIVLLGGGYATLHAYRELVRRTRADQVEITVIAADDAHSFHGFTPEVVSGLLPYEATRARLGDLFPRAAFVHGQIRSVDRGRRVVHVRLASGQREDVGYDQLVIGTGGTEPVAGIPGLAEHGCTLRAPGALPEFLARLDRLVIAGGGTVVVVGAGPAGAEIAAAVADRADRSGAAVRVVLVGSDPTLLPELRAGQPRLARRARTELARLGVEVRLGVRVVEVREDQVRLGDGSIEPASLVLATTGQRPVVLPGLERLPRDAQGRLLTTETLAVGRRIWAAGDCANVAHPVRHTAVPANALWAIKAGAHLGRNLAAVVNGATPKRFTYRGLGSAATFGRGHSVAEVYGVPFTGATAWVLRLVFFLWFMPSRRTAVRALGHLVRAARVARTPNAVADLLGDVTTIPASWSSAGGRR